MDALEAMKMAREVLRNGILYGTEFSSALAALDAAIAAAEQAQPVTLMDVTLDQPACELLFTMLHPCTPEDGSEYSEVRLQFGDGHGGFGLYVSLAEYPEEGSELLVSAEPTNSARPVSDERLRELLPNPDTGLGPHKWAHSSDQMLAFARAVLEESRK